MPRENLCDIYLNVNANAARFTILVSMLVMSHGHPQRDKNISLDKWLNGILMTVSNCTTHRESRYKAECISRSMFEEVAFSAISVSMLDMIAKRED